MKTIIVNTDIKLFYVTASSFPDGVMAAFDKLYAVAPKDGSRKYYGISRPEHGVITYRAAAEEITNGEGDLLQCDSMLLPKGNYISMIIKDFMQHLPDIGKTFQTLLSHPGLDPNGYCVEEYVNDSDVLCMVRLA